MKKVIRVVTRGSQLALTQSKDVIKRLENIYPGHEFKLNILKTDGDRFQSIPLSSFTRTGIFVKELENALLAGEGELAVHSLKDAPTSRIEGLTISAYLEREDWRDSLVWPAGKRPNNDSHQIIGTGSLRRRLQLQSRFPEWEFREIRGNVDTRLKKMLDGDFHAILLATAGMNRLNLLADNSTIEHEKLDEALMLPAPGQGCVAIETRSSDSEVISLVKELNHTETAVCVQAERYFLSEMEGGCKTPIGVLAQIKNAKLCLDAWVGDPRNGKSIRSNTVGELAQFKNLAENLAREMRKDALANGIDYTFERHH
ncbi:MAG: hydroxymethylbilane synthase [Leptospiraceae bacterium]|nr:hydroxymethylbilane synthase [Leptospiraceae bacterium]